MENYTDYIGINLEGLKGTNFSWKVNDQEEELIESANSIMKQLIDHKRNEIKDKKASKKGIRGIIRWAKLNPVKSSAYASVVGVAIFLGINLLQ